MTNPESISSVRINDVDYPIDAVTVGGKSASDFQENMLVTTINASSDDVHYPSAKAVYTVLGDIESRLRNI